MSCQQPAGESAYPCCLAGMDLCRYCAYLQGQTACKWGWPRFCGYENFVWNRQFIPDLAENVVVDILSFSETAGMLVKTEKKFTGMPMGTIFEIRPAGMPHNAVKGVLLYTHPELDISYIAFLAPVAQKIFKGAKIELRMRENAFLGYPTINGAYDKDVIIWCRKALMTVLHPLELSLKERNNRAGFKPLDTDISAGTNADIVLIAGSGNEIKRAASHLPSSRHSKVVLWYINSKDWM